MAVLGEISISGTILKVEELASVLRVCFDAGAKNAYSHHFGLGGKGSAGRSYGSLQPDFLQPTQEAVFKALGQG